MIYSHTCDSAGPVLVYHLNRIVNSPQNMELFKVNGIQRSNGAQVGRFVNCLSKSVRFSVP